MARIRYAVVQWREIEVPEGTPVPSDDPMRWRRTDDIVQILADLGVIVRGSDRSMVAVSDGAALVDDNEYGYMDWVSYEP